MQGTDHAIVALVGAYVLSEPMASFIGSRLGMTSISRHGIWGVLASALSFLFLGILSGWLIALLTGGTAALASWLEGRRGGALRLLTVRIVTLGALLLLAAWCQPLIDAWMMGSAQAGIASSWWPSGFFTILAVLTGGYVTVEWGCSVVDRAIRPFASAMSGAEREEPGLPSGGRMIGRLERMVIFLFVIVNSPTAIGFLVTAKSILRFGEIKDREMQRVAEYIIIGTLMSFAYALIAGYLTRLALVVSGRSWLLENLAF